MQLRRGTRTEPPPELGVLRFLNFHDQPHEVTVGFDTDEGERLYEYTASLAAGSEDEPTTDSVEPEAGWPDWTMRSTLDGEMPDAAGEIAQERIEYTHIDVEFWVMPDERLRVRVENDG
jgi:hypothetical protein